MLKLLFDFVGDAALLIIPVYFVYIIMISGNNILKNSITYFKLLKLFICLNLTVYVIVSSFIMMSMSVLYVATTFMEVEDLPVWFNSAVFASVQFLLSIIAVVVIHNIWKYLYYQQIIPGNGSIKKRLVDLKNDLFKKKGKI